MKFIFEMRLRAAGIERHTSIDSRVSIAESNEVASWSRSLDFPSKYTTGSSYRMER